MKKISSFFKSYIDIIALIFTEHKDNISQVFKLSVADLKKTYTGSALGWAWAVIKPLFTVFIYWFAVSVGLRSGSDIGEYPYILWLVSGIIAWFFMTECITGGTNCIRRYSYLVTKMKYPITTIPTFTNLASFYIHLVLVVFAVVMFWVMGFAPTVYLLQLPLYMLLMFLFFNAWSLFAGLVSAISKDFSNLIKSVNIGIFWLSGVIWNVNNVGDSKILKIIMAINPVTFICYGYRNCFVDHKWFFEEPEKLAIFLGWYILLGILSLWAYKKLRKEIPDVL